MARQTGPIQWETHQEYRDTLIGRIGGADVYEITYRLDSDMAEKNPFVARVYGYDGDAEIGRFKTLKAAQVACDKYAKRFYCVHERQSNRRREIARMCWCELEGLTDEEARQRFGAMLRKTDEMVKS